MTFGGLFVKPLHQSFFPDRTILAMFFQSSKIRKATTDLPDGKHMSGCPDRQTHTCMRRHQEASVKTLFPCLDVRCHPEVNSPAAWRVMEACSPHAPPTYSHVFACEMSRGLEVRPGKEPGASQGRRFRPSVNAGSPPDPHPRPVEGFVHRSVTAAALLRVTARLQHPANAQGGFSVCAVDLGLVLQQKAASVRRRAPHDFKPKALSRKVFFRVLFSAFFSLTDTSRKLGLWPRRYLRNGDKWRRSEISGRRVEEGFQCRETFNSAVNNH